MKKFKRLFLSLCVVCLTLFVLPSSIYAYEYKGSTYSVSLMNDNSYVTDFYYGTDWNNNHSSGTYIFDEIACSVVVSGMGNSLMNVQGQFQCTMNPFVKRLTIYLVNETMGYVQGVKTLYERNEDIITFNCDIQCDFVPNRCYIRLLMRQDYNRFISFGMKYLQINEIDESSESMGIGNVNSGISNIQSSITTINSDIVAINSNITGVNNTLSQFESNVEEDFVQLRNTMSEESSNISNSISSFENSFIENISFVNEGIANAWKTSQSIESFVKQIIDLIQTTNSNLSLIYTDMGKWFGEFIDWYDLILRQLINIQSQTVTNTNDLINALGAHDSALALNLSNLGNSLLNGMNTLNTDIQNQMITQTSNITNNIVAQTNALNSSIKTMENSVTTKLDDTLVIKDKAGVDSNDSSTEDLESAITDYDSVEKDLVTDFNESLDSIDTDSASSIYSQNDFVKTAQFISTNMQNVYESNDFVGGMIDVTLLLGLIFTVIGIGVR